MRNCLRCSLMDIANVVFVCGRQMRRDDPFLEVGNAMYSYTVKRFSFSFIQLFVSNLAPTCDSAHLSNLYIASSETVFIHTTKVVLSRASWFCWRPGSSHIWRSIRLVPTGLLEQMSRSRVEKFSVNFSSSSFVIRGLLVSFQLVLFHLTGEQLFSG